MTENAAKDGFLLDLHAWSAFVRSQSNSERAALTDAIEEGSVNICTCTKDDLVAMYDGDARALLREGVRVVPNDLAADNGFAIRFARTYPDIVKRIAKTEKERMLYLLSKAKRLRLTIVSGQRASAHISLADLCNQVEDLRQINVEAFVELYSPN